MPVPDPLAAGSGGGVSGGATQASQALQGYKGSSFVDPGYIYCPFVPLTQTPVVLDPNDFVSEEEPEERINGRLPKPEPFRTLDDDWNW